MTEEERFLKANSHVMDALDSKPPRPINYSPELTDSYYALYYLQNSRLWSVLMLVLSFAYMYLVILEG